MRYITRSSYLSRLSKISTIAQLYQYFQMFYKDTTFGQSSPPFPHMRQDDCIALEFCQVAARDTRYFSDHLFNLELIVQ